ncbi:hypothetical protein NADFUDRAFT_39721 [Nadsonia fulvescens var. elongata DSM 6958]|uniref:SPT2-domain-containing protein n=1 Tax=Nadsonia fulvescens var. elongata DSM 6958 TaxID=857566 RepID=A0A1E3PSC0_9ASCO|nr:hypothetical protein NADFUDRAFT_39721 [Nadsonia fulvescens var. elongata DSM 6958]
MSFSSLLAKVSNKPASSSSSTSTSVKPTSASSSKLTVPSTPSKNRLSPSTLVSAPQTSRDSQGSKNLSREKQIQLEKIARLKAERAKEKGITGGSANVNISKPSSTGKKLQSSTNPSVLSAKTNNDKIIKDRRTGSSSTSSRSASNFSEPSTVSAMPKKKLKFSDLLQHAEKNFDPSKVKMTVKVKDNKTKPSSSTTISSSELSSIPSLPIGINDKNLNLHSSKRVPPSVRNNRSNPALNSSKPISLSLAASTPYSRLSNNHRNNGANRTTKMTSPLRTTSINSSKVVQKPSGSQRPIAISRTSDLTKQRKLNEPPARSRTSASSTPAPFSRPSDRLLKRLETVKHKRNGGYDSDSSLDDFVVEDEDEDPGYIDARPDIWSLVNGNRRRAWVDDDEFDDDMEATGEDIFDEERKSEYVAKYEDKKEEFEERKRAEEKKKRRK